MLGLFRSDYHDPALVGDDQVGQRDKSASACDDRADGAAGGLVRTSKSRSAGEHGKAQTPDGTEVTYGPVYDESRNAPGHRGHCEHLTPDAVTRVLGLHHNDCTSLSACNGNVNHQVVA